MPATSSFLFMFSPLSSKNIASSSKYLFQGAWSPGATESTNSWVLRTSSSWLILGRLALLHDNVTIKIQITQEIVAMCLGIDPPTSRLLSFKLSSAFQLDAPECPAQPIKNHVPA